MALQASEKEKIESVIRELQEVTAASEIEATAIMTICVVLERILRHGDEPKVSLQQVRDTLKAIASHAGIVERMLTS